jgi:hypothetical protein
VQLLKNFATFKKKIYIEAYIYIQDVLEGKVNIVEGHSIGHSKQKKCICTCVLFRKVFEIELVNSTIKNC